MKAEERALDIIVAALNAGDIGSQTYNKALSNGIAEALRQVRRDALEEAAQHLKSRALDGFTYPEYSDDEVDCIIGKTHYRMASDDIRALMEKEGSASV